MKTTNHSEQSSAPARGEIILYQTADGNTSIDVKLENETVWLTQDQLVILFQRDKSVISRHIKNIFQEGELDPKVVVAKFATTTPHGAIIGGIQTHEVVFYNLDVIISVGYRVCPPAVPPVNFSIDYTLSHIQLHKNNFAFI